MEYLNGEKLEPCRENDIDARVEICGHITPQIGCRNCLLAVGVSRVFDHAAVFHNFDPCDRSCPAEERERIARLAREDAEAVGLVAGSPEPMRRAKSQPLTHRIPFEDVQKMRAAVGRK